MTPEQERAEDPFKEREYPLRKGSLIRTAEGILFSRAAPGSIPLLTEPNVEMDDVLDAYGDSLDREEQLMQQYEKYSEALKGAKTTNLELARKVAEQDKEIQQYKAALEEIAQGGDKDYVGNVLTLTSSECRTIARKALNQS